MNVEIFVAEAQNQQKPPVSEKTGHQDVTCEAHNSCVYPSTDGLPMNEKIFDLLNILHGGQWMDKVHNGVKPLPNISIS